MVWHPVLEIVTLNSIVSLVSLTFPAFLQEGGKGGWVEERVIWQENRKNIRKLYYILSY